MSQFGFGSQIGSQRDALSGGSRSNYASEEADLTDGLISQVEKINIPNTNQFYENIKFVEKIKEQGNLINTLKQVANTFEAGAKFKSAIEAAQGKKDDMDAVRNSADWKTIADVSDANAKIEAQQDKEETDVARELNTESQETDDPKHKDHILDLTYDIYNSPEKLNMRQLGNNLEGSIPSVFENIATQTGLDSITTTGEAREFLDTNSIAGKIYSGLLYEYDQANFDITKKSVRNKILAKHAKTILKARDAVYNTWSTNHKAKVRLAQEKGLETDAWGNFSQGNANAMFGDGGLVEQTNNLIYGGQSLSASSIWMAETVAKGIEANVVIGTEGLTISDNNIDDMLHNNPVTINNKKYPSYSEIPDNVISATVKNQTMNIIKDAMRKRQTEQANNIETDRKNFNNTFVLNNVTQPLQNLTSVKARQLFLASDNFTQIQINYQNEITKPENKHLQQFTSDGKLMMPQEILGAVAKSDTGGTDTNVATAEKYSDTFNKLEKKLISTAVSNYKYGEGEDKVLVGADLITVERARDDLKTKFLSRSEELEMLLENRPRGKSAKSIELDFIQGIFETDILPNIQKGLYDKAGTTGVTKDLIFNKGILIEQFENNQDLKDSPVPMGLAEKNNFERSKSWLESGRTINKDVLKFYEDVPMSKVLANGTKVPMTNLEKWVYRAKAIGALNDKDGDKILEFDDTRQYFTDKDLAKLRKLPTDGKFLQIGGEALPNFKDLVETVLKSDPSASFDTFDANFPTTGRSPRSKSNLQILSLEQIQGLVLTNEMTDIGYFKMNGETLYNTINELVAKGFMKKGQRFDKKAQLYTKLYTIQKNINQRKRSLSGLTVIPYAKGKQPLTMGIGGKGTDGGTTTLGNTQDDTEWLDMPNFSMEDIEVLEKLFPLMESNPMSSFANMTKGVSKVFLDAPDKRKFFEKDRYKQHEINRKEILKSLSVLQTKPRTTNPRERKFGKKSKN